MPIRPIAPADIPAAASLLRRAAVEFILHESTPEGAAHFLAEQSEDGLRAFIAAGMAYHVAEIDGELAGFIGIRARSHVFHLFVDKRWQRRGIARRLWETAHAAALGPVHPGVFTVNASNYAVPLYEALGFVRTAPMQFRHVCYNPMRFGSAPEHEPAPAPEPEPAPAPEQAASAPGSVAPSAAAFVGPA